MIIGNPFGSADRTAVLPPATAVVIFGASGDLTSRKLIPALYNLFCDGYLPTPYAIIGVARTNYSSEEFAQHLRGMADKFSRRPVENAHWQDFAQQIHYCPLDATTPDGYAGLVKLLDQLDQDCGCQLNRLFYLATAPRFFGPIARALRMTGLVTDDNDALRASRLVIEKPFGNDLKSAAALNRELRQEVPEKQIYRIDHYLGKETVQNILMFRFGNGLFEPLWNRKYIDHIQITVAESVGVGDRAGYFDQSGITRDIVQNHLLQMLALLCIEPPNSLANADSIRNEKVKVLQALRRFEPDDVPNYSIRGQYGPGFIEGDAVRGYQQELGTDKRSRTETYIAMKLCIDNWRWEGVPIYIRAGKRLPKRITEISVTFHRPPATLWSDNNLEPLEPNVLAIQVQPAEGIALSINSKSPGPRLRAQSTVMDFSYGESFGIPSPDAYERLLLDAVRGDATLFTRHDEIEQAWDLLEPLWSVWQGEQAAPLHQYEAGSWGPESAAELFRNTQRRWRIL